MSSKPFVSFKNSASLVAKFHSIIFKRHASKYIEVVELTEELFMSFGISSIDLYEVSYENYILLSQTLLT